MAGTMAFVDRIDLLLRRAGRRPLRWRYGLRAERNFWQQWVGDQGGAYAAEYQQRMDPNASIDDEFMSPRVARVPTERVRILDVGAGPATTVGKTYPGKIIELTAVDPLADHYAKALNAHGVVPPVSTELCAGEELTAHFERGSFDIVHARNSLDHAYDPLLVIREMLEVTRGGGSVLLFHGRNEAEKERYLGLHQWNFEIEQDGRLVLWGRDARYDIAAELAGLAAVEAWLDVSDDGERVAVALTRS